jgi:hypothetical protein
VTSAVVSAIAKGSFLGQAGWSVGDHEIWTLLIAKSEQVLGLH